MSTISWLALTSSGIPHTHLAVHILVLIIQAAIQTISSLRTCNRLIRAHDNILLFILGDLAPVSVTSLPVQLSDLLPHSFHHISTLAGKSYFSNLYFWHCLAFHHGLCKLLVSPSFQIPLKCCGLVWFIELNSITVVWIGWEDSATKLVFIKAFSILYLDKCNVLTGCEACK